MSARLIFKVCSILLVPVQCLKENTVPALKESVAFIQLELTDTVREQSAVCPREPGC